MNAPAFTAISKIKAAHYQKFELEGESEMKTGKETYKATKWNITAKIVTGLALGALLIATPIRGGSILADEPARPLSSSLNYGEIRLAESIEERFKVQRVQQEMLGR